jgi:hypothetical protein
MPISDASGAEPTTIRPASTPRSAPRPEADWPVEIRLPNGRRVRATLSPPVARRHDLAELSRVVAANDKNAFDASEQQAQTLERLERSHRALTKKLVALQERADQALISLAQGLSKVKEQAATIAVQDKVIRQERVALNMRTRRQQQSLRAMATTAQVNQVTAVVNSTQAAAYGERGSVFATNNLLLAGNQLFWMFLNPALRSMGVLGAEPNVLTFLTPVGSLVTGHVVLGNRQHERFISGFANFDGTSNSVKVPLKDRLASDFFKEFRKRKNVLVTVTTVEGLSGRTPVGSVVDGELRITANFGFDVTGAISSTTFARGRVAWIVDTGSDVG